MVKTIFGVQDQPLDQPWLTHSLVAVYIVPAVEIFVSKNQLQE